MRKIVIYVCMLTLFGCSGNWTEYPPPPKETVVDKKQTIEIGDTVHISIFDETDLSGDYVVLQDGTIQIPLVGEVQVENLLLTDAADKIESTMRQKGYLVNPQVTLSIAQFKTVKIMGEIAKTGEYPFKDGMTILDVVASAGGFSYRARQEDFDIVRKTSEGMEEVIQGQISTRVKAGDIIRVRERYF